MMLTMLVKLIVILYLLGFCINWYRYIDNNWYNITREMKYHDGTFNYVEFIKSFWGGFFSSLTWPIRVYSYVLRGYYWND